MKPLKNVVVALLVTVSLLLSAPVAWSTPMAGISYVETGSTGAWQYDFNFHNTSDPVADAGADLFDVFITLGSTFSPTSVAAPLGWDYFDFGWGDLEFYSSNPGIPPIGFDIAPGSSLGGFLVVLSDQLPAGTPKFTALLVNPDGGDPIPYPAAVPEPSTFLLLGAGLLGAIGIFRQRVTSK
jgi:hypothetical protein